MGKRKSKIVTDYPNCKLNAVERIAKKRLQIAVNAMDKKNALKIFKQSSIFNVALVTKI